MRTGLIAGSIAAIVAVLVSLPLRSPSDSFVNSLTVAAGALLVGLAAGAVWSGLAESRRRPLYFAGILLGCLAGVTILAAALETQVDRAITFSAPLAAIAFALTGALIPALDRASLARRRWSAPVAAVVALGIGVGLAGQGNEASGELSLPPRAESSVAASPTTSVAQPEPSTRPLSVRPPRRPRPLSPTWWGTARR